VRHSYLLTVPSCFPAKHQAAKQSYQLCSKPRLSIAAWKRDGHIQCAIFCTAHMHAWNTRLSWQYTPATSPG